MAAAALASAVLCGFLRGAPVGHLRMLEEVKEGTGV